MDFYKDIYRPFFEELVEHYRHQFYQEEEGRKLQLEQRQTAERLHR